MTMVFHFITGGNGRGGAEGVLFRLIRNCPTACRHRVYTLQPLQAYADEFRAIGIELHSLEIRNPSRFIPELRRLATDVDDFRPDVFQTWMYHSDLFAGLAGKFFGIPVVWNVRVVDNEGLGTLSFRTRLIARACALLSEAVPRTIVSCSMKAIASHIAFGYADNFTYIPNGFLNDSPPSDPLNGASVRQQLKTDRAFRPFGYFARLDPAKGQAQFVQAFRKLHEGNPHLCAVMAGTGIDFSNPDFRKITGGGPCDGLLALGQYADTSVLMPAFDIFVLFSFAEGFPNAVAEAMLHGKPCIVSDVGDSADVVGDTGWVVPAGNIEALTAAMAQAADLSDDELERRGSAARQRIVDNYGMGRMVDGYLRVWRHAEDGGIG